MPDIKKYKTIAVYNAAGMRAVINEAELSVWRLNGWSTEKPQPKEEKPEQGPAITIEEIKTAVLSLGPDGMKLDTAPEPEVETEVENPAPLPQPILPKIQPTRRRRGR